MKFFGKPLLTILVLCCFCFQAEATDDQNITVTIPEVFIQKAFDAFLPYTFDVNTDTIEGKLTIERIYDTHLQDQRITGQVKLSGSDLVIKTIVVNQQINLQFGSAVAHFGCDADLRFDVAEQTLYIRPLPQKQQAQDNEEEGNIGEAFLLMLDGQEFPIELQNIQPFIAKSTGKTVTVDTRISDIRAVPGILLVQMEPVISSQP